MKATCPECLTYLGDAGHPEHGIGDPPMEGSPPFEHCPYCGASFGEDGPTWHPDVETESGAVGVDVETDAGAGDVPEGVQSRWWSVGPLEAYAYHDYPTRPWASPLYAGLRTDVGGHSVEARFDPDSLARPFSTTSDANGGENWATATAYALFAAAIVASFTDAPEVAWLPLGLAVVVHQAAAWRYGQ